MDGTEMDYFIEISRIVEGALSGDKKRVVAYLDQLSKKLKRDGDEPTAKMFFNYIKTANMDSLTTSGVQSARLTAFTGR